MTDFDALGGDDRLLFLVYIFTLPVAKFGTSAAAAAISSEVKAVCSVFASGKERDATKDLTRSGRRRSVISPLGKWSLVATIVIWYPGYVPTPSASSTASLREIFRSAPAALGTCRHHW